MSDDQLRDAFQEMGAHASADGVDAERVWRAVSGESDAEERRAVVERTAADPSWALAWRAAHELWTASHESEETARRPARGTTRLAWGVLAACLIATVGTLLVRAPRGPAHRGDAEARIHSLLPEGRAVPRSHLVLRWTGPRDVRYDLRMTSEDLLHVHAATGLAATEYRPPDAFLSSLPAAATVLWQVEARLADGSTLRSETFVTRIE